MTMLETFVAGIKAEPQPLLAKTSGKLLFEVRDRDDTASWIVDIDKGVVAIESADRDVAVDAIIRADVQLVEEIAEGRANAMAAVLRGEMTVEGDSELLMVFQRIFPGPNDPRRP